MSFKKWYDTNKEEFNRRRAQKYASDPAMREKAKERQKRYRQVKRTRVQKKPPMVDINGVMHEVFRIGFVSQQVGRTEQVIRDWEKKEIIPKPSVKSIHRYYTTNQIALLAGLAEVLNEVRYKPALREKAVSKESAKIFLNWEN